MSKRFTFDEFWKLANPRNHGGSGLYYHPCCDVWTTRSCKSTRASHTQKIQWRLIAGTLDKRIEDRKQALFIKMTEEHWQLPALLNIPCKIQPLPSIPPQLSSDSSSTNQPQQDLPLQSGAFNYTRQPGFIIPQQTTTESFEHKGFIEPGKQLDTVSLNSFSLPARSQTVSQE